MTDTTTQAVEMIEQSTKRQHFTDVRYVTVRWEPYKPDGARQMKAKGRWQEQVGSGDYFRWQNCDRPAFAHDPETIEDLRAQLAAANARADAVTLALGEWQETALQQIAARESAEAQLAGARDAALVEAARLADGYGPVACDTEMRAAILALRDKPAETAPQPDLCSTSELQTAPVVTVDIDALVYRFWSIHPKDIPDPVGMPKGYKGGARAWMYATEIREAIRAIAGGGDE